MSSRLSHRRSPERAFGLAELSIGLALTSVLLIGAYKFSSQTVMESAASTYKTGVNRDLDRALDQLNAAIENAIALPSAPDDSPLAVAKPANTSGCDGFATSASAATWTQIGTGLVPFPGATTADLSSNPSAADPSLPLNSTEKNDAIRLAYLPSDSVAIFLAVEDDGDGNPSNDVVYSTSGSDPIRVEDKGNLAVGDYAMIWDSTKTAFFRITAIEGPVSGLYDIEHGAASVWNQPFSDFGTVSDGGRAFIQKVLFVDYAVDPAKQTLMLDSHVKDDGFNPSGTPPFSGGARRVADWAVATTGIAGFQIQYNVGRVSMSGGERTITPLSTRTPRGWEMNDVSCNEIGYPNFRSISLVTTLTLKEVTRDHKVVDKQVDVARETRAHSLAHAPDLGGTSDTLAGAPFEDEGPPSQGGGNCNGFCGGGAGGGG